MWDLLARNNKDCNGNFEEGYFFLLLKRSGKANGIFPSNISVFDGAFLTQSIYSKEELF